MVCHLAIPPDAHAGRGVAGIYLANIIGSGAGSLITGFIFMEHFELRWMTMGLFIAAHIATRKLAPGADGLLLPIAALLNGIGYVMIARLDEASSRPEGLAAAQAGWTVIGIGAFIATLVIVRHSRDLQRYRYTFLLLGLLLLLAPLAPGIGREVNGARIWAYIGPINFQPGEFAKLALAIFFAGYLAENRELIAESTWRVGPVRLPEPRHLLPIVLAWGFTIVESAVGEFLKAGGGCRCLTLALDVTLGPDRHPD
jgi:cell division protein FtsW (lipid II flippase)